MSRGRHAKGIRAGARAAAGEGSIFRLEVRVHDGPEPYLVEDSPTPWPPYRPGLLLRIFDEEFRLQELAILAVEEIRGDGVCTVVLRCEGPSEN